MDSIEVNGNYEIVAGAEDFSYLVEKYMGYEAKNYYEEVLREYGRTIEDLEYQISEMRTKLLER